jgi:hypothetical protein
MSVSNSHLLRNMGFISGLHSYKSTSASRVLMHPQFLTPFSPFH